jgi:hypothetical protein
MINLVKDPESIEDTCNHPDADMALRLEKIRRNEYQEFGKKVEKLEWIFTKVMCPLLMMW